AQQRGPFPHGQQAGTAAAAAGRVEAAPVVDDRRSQLVRRDVDAHEYLVCIGVTEGVAQRLADDEERLLDGLRRSPGLVAVDLDAAGQVGHGGRLEEEFQGLFQALQRLYQPEVADRLPDRLGG